jgi:hypothetical protein
MNKIIISIGMVFLLVFVAAGPPPLNNISECTSCHEPESTLPSHHTTTLVSCIDCHVDPQGNFSPEWQFCTNCHDASIHHEDVSGECSNCHEDKQKRRGRK